MSGLLSLINIKKSFTQGGHSFEVLSNINLTLIPGQIVALIGPSGSGKSTLLQIAGLIERPTSGTILIGDKSCTELSDAKITQLRRHYLGFVFQFHHLLPEFTALENTAMPLLIQGVANKQALARAKEVLNEVGLANKFASLPYELSGGEQQRVAIARALVHNPKIIFADEPTGSLDPQNGELVFNVFYYAVKKHNASAIIVTHNVEIAKKADRILTIRGGQIEEIHVQ